MCINRAKGTSLHTMEVVKTECICRGKCIMYMQSQAQRGEVIRGKCIYKRVIRAAECV